MPFLGLSRKQIKQLEFEVIPFRARLQLTRLLRGFVEAVDDNKGFVIRSCGILNICRNVLSEPVVIVEADGYGEYEFFDTAWVRSELEACMRVPDTFQLVETIADLMQAGWVKEGDINDIFSDNGVGVSFSKKSEKVKVKVLPVEQIEESEEQDIPNIRLLVSRMDTAFQGDDHSGVLHASASIFETLAKDVVKMESVENQTLASFFDRYKKDSSLPEPVLNYMLEIYKKRNTEPLAGHGSTKPPEVTRDEAIILAEMTKAFVRIERQLGLTSILPPKRTS